MRLNEQFDLSFIISFTEIGELQFCELDYGCIGDRVGNDFLHTFFEFKEAGRNITSNGLAKIVPGILLLHSDVRVRVVCREAI